MLPMKALVAFGTIPVVPVTGTGPIMTAVPMGGWTPVASSPDPVIIVPSPTSTDPDVTRRWAGWHSFEHGRRHWWLHNDRRGSDHHRSRCYNYRCRNWDSNVDTETNPGVCCGDSQSSQGHNCDSFFHNL